QQMSWSAAYWVAVMVTGATILALAAADAHNGVGAPTPPAALGIGLRNLHKRPYPRWYNSYISRVSSFDPRSSLMSERKRFLPFHPLARFRGLSVSDEGVRDRQRYYEMPLSDAPAYTLPSAPAVAPGQKYSTQSFIKQQQQPIIDREMELEDDDNEGDDEHEFIKTELPNRQIAAGELIGLLQRMAANREVGRNAKIFRFGANK
ncbi:unnamed protein product, partial [Meganyctiphanes norvegica]